MNTIIKYNQFLMFTHDMEKYFHAEFKNGVNIIYGANTSGKSSILQAINFTFGINDESYKLSELLSENVIFRIDFEVIRDESLSVTIIRNGEYIYVKERGHIVKPFYGVSSNNSEEHKRLKNYLSELLGFDLKLETQGEKKSAPIEAMFLPYYISQDYGWVVTLKSFRGFEFYRKFKESYYDYYLNIQNESDSEEKFQLEKLQKMLLVKADVFSQIIKSDREIEYAMLNDEEHILKATEYVEKFKSNKDELIKIENLYVVTANKLKYEEQRVSMLRRIKNNLSLTINNATCCPLCQQKVSYSIDQYYSYFQDRDDTDEQIITLTAHIKKLTSKLNSHKNKINKLRDIIEREYSVLEQCSVNNLSMNTWLKNKINAQLANDVIKQKGQIQLELENIKDQLKTFKTEEDIIVERKSKSDMFNDQFYIALKSLGVNTFNERYDLYRMGLFPQQGVELLKTLLAYHFILNRMISQSQNIHRLPLCLDAIFKEDVTEENKLLILNYVNKHRPNDTQLIFSVAESYDSRLRVSDFNKQVFNNSANLIAIGYETRCLLREVVREAMPLLIDTIDIMTSDAVFD